MLLQEIDFKNKSKYQESNFQKLVEDCSKIQERFGLPPSSPSPSLFNDFSNLDEVAQTEVILNLQLMISATHELEPDTNEISKESEIKCLQNFLDTVSLKIKDKDLIGKIDENNIIEIFSAKGVQLYRSWSYFLVSSYSVADLLIYDWDELYERPKSILNTLMSLMSSLFTETANTINYSDYGLKPYILRERHNMSDRLVKLDMLYACPIINKETGRVCAFISIEKGTLVKANKKTVSFL